MDSNMKMTMKKRKSGIRQKLNKSVIFQGLQTSWLVFSMLFNKYFVSYIFAAAGNLAKVLLKKLDWVFSENICLWKYIKNLRVSVI